MTLRERIAQAIAGPGPWENLPACRPYCLSIADDCLRAMREPTRIMRLAAVPMQGAHYVVGDPDVVWRAMIDAALSETNIEGR